MVFFSPLNKITMKKIILIIAVVGLATSCKKDRVCTCTNSQIVTNSNNTNTSSQVYDVTLVKVSKRTAKLACIHTKSSNVNNNTTVTSDTDCKLK